MCCHQPSAAPLPASPLACAGQHTAEDGRGAAGGAGPAGPSGQRRRPAGADRAAGRTIEHLLMWCGAIESIVSVASSTACEVMWVVAGSAPAGLARGACLSELTVHEHPWPMRSSLVLQQRLPPGLVQSSARAPRSLAAIGGPGPPTSRKSTSNQPARAARGSDLQATGGAPAMTEAPQPARVQGKHRWCCRQ